MLNKVMIIGRLGRDPELRYIQGSGTPVATLNVATDDSFVDRDGKRLGTHRGIIGYTVGQRRGLGIAAGRPLYVTAIQPETNRVVLGDNADLFRRELDVRALNWIAFDRPPARLRAKVKVRYRQTEQPATITVTGEDRVRVCFDAPQRAITAGQAAVFYDGDTVLGGGTIDKV